MAGALDGAVARPSLGAVARDLLALTKPRITLMVVTTFAGGLALAPGEMPRWRSVFVLLGTAMIVGAANALNMFMERDVDGLMARTRNRPLVQERLRPESALGLGLALGIWALPLLQMGGNGATAALGFLAFVSYLLAYTPLKRRSWLALFAGAVPGALPPLMGWTAVTGRLAAPGLALFGVLFFWQIPHFLAIAMFREADYTRAGFKVLSFEGDWWKNRLVAMTNAVALVAVSLTLQPLGVAGWGYSVAAAILGLTFLVWCAIGFSRAATRRWARSLFIYSLFYLTLLFVALVVDRQLG